MSRTEKRNAKSNRRKNSPKKKNKLFYILMTVAAVLLCVICVTEIVTYHHKNVELEKRKERLETLLSDEDLRQQALEDEEVYVKTKEFIEEKARSIGYVYPDEIIFKKGD